MTRAQSVIAYIGIGSNMDNPALQVAQALRELEELPHTRLVRSSSLYETEPIGFAGQSSFINAVVAVDTSLTPRELLDGLLEIEKRHGRVRAQRNGPRTLDLDVLLYGHRVLMEDGLTVPHPRMHERGFVIEPLLEVDPECEIPGLGAAAQFRASVKDQGVKLLGS
jgi:2-amino-4-hydroxy-6-hydroxymethyldihydropteridine diphosphokinase